MTEGLNFTYIPRTLLEQDYPYKLFFFKLTEIEAYMCFGLVFVIWVVASITGLDEATIIGFPLDPLAWWGSGVALAAIISFGHKIRPEGSIELVLMGWAEPMRYISRKSEGDKNWFPNLIRPHYKQSGIRKISLGILKKKKSFRALPDFKNSEGKKRNTSGKSAATKKKGTAINDKEADD